MAPVVRVEPCEMKLLDSNPELLAKVEVAGRLPFIRRFLDSNPEVTRLFALSLDDSRVKIANLQFQVDERSVALATGLSITGERWFKYKPMEVTEWRQMLKNPCQDVSFRTGVALKYFKKEWRPVLDLIHRYVTCEGCLSSAYVYHLQLMSVFISFPLNLPHYLVQILSNMSAAIKKGPKKYQSQFVSSRFGQNVNREGIVEIRPVMV